MKIMLKQINEDATNYLVYVMDLANSPLICEFATNENKTDVVNKLSNQFGNVSIVEEMTYNEYINQ